SHGATDRIVVVLDEDATGAVAQVSGSIHSGTDEVALNQNIRALEKDAVVSIGGNNVAACRSRAADGVNACRFLKGEDLHAAGDVSQSHRAGDVRADIVALDQIARRRGIKRESDAVTWVAAGNDIACAGGRSANRVIAAVKGYAAIIRDCRRAGGICADEIALNNQAVCRTRGNAIAAIAGNYIPGSGHGAANEIVGRAKEVNAGGVPAQRCIARGLDPDEVTLNRLAVRRTSPKIHASTVV